MSVVFLKKKVPKRYFRLITLCEELEDMVEELEEIIRSNDALELSIALTQTSSLVMTIEQELLRLIDNPEIRKNALFCYWLDPNARSPLKRNFKYFSIRNVL